MTSIRKVIIAVPARLKSSRLPGKVLADINGKPMLLRVLERCSLSQKCDEVVVCTDSLEILNLSAEWGFRSVQTPSTCTSGSERIGHALKELIGPTSIDSSLIVNVQGDQPFVDPALIDKMISHCSSLDKIPDVVTPVYRLTDTKKINNPNIVKVVIRRDGRALYFSRGPIPWERDRSPSFKRTSWGHVGIYAYRASVLAEWLKLPDSDLEKMEQLEYLRLLDHGYTIETITTENGSLSVDTAEQLEEAILLARSLESSSEVAYRN